MAELETTDTQLMVGSLQGVIRENERVMAELRAELETRRQELGMALVAKAHLEGRLRDVERRLTEARHIIDLQREELVFSRAERERLLSGRFRSPSKAKPKSTPSPSRGGAAVAPSSVPIPPPVFPPANDGSGAAVPSMPPVPDVEPRAVTPPPGDPETPAADPAEASAESSLVGSLIRSVAVRAGDTLYSLARRYGVDLRELRAANGLENDRILVGQALVLPPSRDRTGR